MKSEYNYFYNAEIKYYNRTGDYYTSSWEVKNVDGITSVDEKLNENNFDDFKKSILKKYDLEDANIIITKLRILN